MTIADHIRAEEREITIEITTFNHIKSLLQNGASYDLISKSFGIPMEKVQDIIQKIKDSSN